MELLLLTQNLDDYEIGDIIDIHADGFSWGTEEIAKACFSLIQVPDSELGGDLDAARATYLVHLYSDPDAINTKQRKWCVISDDLVEKTVDSTDPFVLSTAVDKALTVTTL